MAASPGEIEALFEATQPQADAIAACYRRHLPLRVASGAVGCLPVVAVTAAVLSQWANRFDATSFYVAAGTFVAAGLATGAVLFRRFAHADAPIHDRADREIVRPLAAALVEGAELSHPSLEPRDWTPARLLPETDGLAWLITRLTGRIAGLPAELDEGAIIFTPRGDGDDMRSPWKFDGWLVRLTLPFAAGGHLRVRSPLPEGHADRERRRAFTPSSALTARLGGARTVEIAPPGHSYAGGARPTDVAPEALVTDAVLALLRENESLQLAALGSELWIVLPRERHAFKGAYRASFDRDVWRGAARSMDLVERVTRAVVAAGGH
jgi:hypothetical protein